MIRLVPLVLSLLGQADQKEQARLFLEQCQNGKFAEASTNFDAKMKEVLGPAKLEQTWKQITQQLGPMGKMGAPRTDRIGASTRVKIRCEFKSMPLDALVSFNAQGQIEGFFLIPAENTSEGAGSDKPADPPYVDATKYTEEPITVGALDWPLPGLLTRPKAVASPPLVILVHGSGPNDRDETIGPNTPFRDLAHGLASRGIAVIRFDKRTNAHKEKYAKDPKLVAAITMEEEVVADALATAAKARSLPGIDTRRIFVLGHSEGGMLAPVIAKRDGKLAGIILMAASNRSPHEILREQLAYVKSVDPAQADAVTKIQKDVESGFARLKAGKLKDDEKIMGVSAAYWKSWQAIESAKVAGSLKGVPAMVLQGGRDYQVTEVDYNAFRSELRGRPNTAFHLYPDLNHLFQKGKGKSTPSEYMKAAPVDAKVVEDIARWVKSIRP
jgi:dienelactone hydrolase